MGNAEYLRRRAQQEREAAMKAVNPRARDAHLEMARNYEGLATGGAALLNQEDLAS